MPYSIEALDTGWAVRGDDGDLVAKHPTKAQALAHMRALYANVSDAAKQFMAPGQQIQHKCDNTSCVRPSHLKAGDNDESVADRYGPKAADEFAAELEGWDELPLDWTEARLLRFADYFGYAIEPNSESALGYSVTNAQGQRLGGFVARSIIDGYLKSPEGKAGPGAGPGGKKKGGGKGGNPALKRQEAIAAAKNALDLVLPDVLEARSKGKVDAAAVEQLKQQALTTIDGATDAKAVRAALQSFRKQLNIYKQEATKPPPADQQLRDTISKAMDALPNATLLAGTKYDEQRIQGALDAGRSRLAAARTPGEVLEATRQLRLGIQLEKLAQDKERIAKGPKKASETARSGALPRTASEWAEYYTRLYFDEEPWMLAAAAGQPW